jgi:hypothetical protein
MFRLFPAALFRQISKMLWILRVIQVQVFLERYSFAGKKLFFFCWAPTELTVTGYVYCVGTLSVEMIFLPGHVIAMNNN